MKNNYNYDFILPFFVSESECREVLQKIHGDKNGYTYATDGHMEIRVPSSVLAKEYKEVENYPNAEKLLSEALSRKENKSCTFLVDDLIEILTKAKWIKQVKGEECPDCGGSGDIRCEECGHIHDCDSCDGTGEINIRLVEFSLLKDAEGFVVKINKQIFRASLLHILAVSAKITGVKKIKYTSDNDASHAGLFKVGEVDILMMPCSLVSENDELKTIPR